MLIYATGICSDISPCTGVIISEEVVMQPGLLVIVLAGKY